MRSPIDNLDMLLRGDNNWYPMPTGKDIVSFSQYCDCRERRMLSLHVSSVLNKSQLNSPGCAKSLVESSVKEPNLKKELLHLIGVFEEWQKLVD